MKYSFSLFVFAAIFTVHAHADDFWNSIFAADADQAALEFTDAATTRTLMVKTVGPDQKRYSARVSNCARDISDIRIKVARAGLTVDSGGAIFSDGSSRTAKLKQSFEAGYVSPWISLETLGVGSLCVTKVFVDAKGNDPNRHSRVEVQARYLN